MFLKSVEYGCEGKSSERFPFNLPLFQVLDRMTFERPVTFFVGENGTGKSTLLEGIAAAVGSITIGAEELERDPSLDPAKTLAGRLRLSWKVKTRRGFFLRAEDFLSYSKKMRALQEEMQKELERVEEEYRHRSILARNLARMPFSGSLGQMNQLYGEGLDVQSHGESFLSLFQSRLVPNGLYLLDEPETPLSPMKQLSLLSLIKEMAGQNCQFIIATHSPILMAYPDACIYSFDERPPREAAYEELEHVNLTRDFLTYPERYLRYL